MAKNVEGPINLVNAYEAYQEYCFYRTEKQEIRRYTTVNELRENLFEQYKFNRNVRDNNKNNIKILKLLTLIDEYEETIYKLKWLNTNFDFGEEFNN